MPSHTVLDGRFALRCAIVNHRTTRADLDLFVDAVLETGTALVTAGSEAVGRE
jgi:hypothetical protein